MRGISIPYLFNGWFWDLNGFQNTPYIWLLGTTAQLRWNYEC
jgi:hypothetical protein